MSNDEELKKYMALIEQYKEQMNQLEMQTQYLQAAITDYNKAKITLEQISNAEVGTDMLLPIGGSTYVDATAKNTSKVLYDIGGGIVTEKTTEDAVTSIDKRLEELQKTQDKLMEMIQNIQTESTEVYSKAQKLLGEQETKNRD
jgi:prefoldin alpha subunit